MKSPNPRRNPRDRTYRRATPRSVATPVDSNLSGTSNSIRVRASSVPKTSASVAYRRRYEASSTDLAEGLAGGIIHPVLRDIDPGQKGYGRVGVHWP